MAIVKRTPPAPVAPVAEELLEEEILDKEGLEEELLEEEIPEEEAAPVAPAKPVAARPVAAPVKPAAKPAPVAAAKPAPAKPAPVAAAKPAPAKKGFGRVGALAVKKTTELDTKPYIVKTTVANLAALGYTATDKVVEATMVALFDAIRNVLATTDKPVSMPHGFYFRNNSNKAHVYPSTMVDFATAKNAHKATTLKELKLTEVLNSFGTFDGTDFVPASQEELDSWGKSDVNADENAEAWREVIQPQIEAQEAEKAAKLAAQQG